MAVKKGQNKINTQGKRVNRPQGRNTYKGKSLLERIGVPKNTRDTKVGKTPASNGLRVVNGKLLHANDVGVLLRDAANRTSKKPTTVFRERKPNKDLRQRTMKKLQVSRPRPAPQPYGKNLYISLKSSATNEFLRIRNLPLGSNSQELTKIVENISHSKLSKINVIDLPSGSVTAEVWFSKSNSHMLSDVQKRLNRANVDGRVVFAEVASVPELQ